MSGQPQGSSPESSQGGSEGITTSQAAEQLEKLLGGGELSDEEEVGEDENAEDVEVKAEDSDEAEESEQSEEGEEAEESPEDEQEPIQSVADLAEALGVSVEDLSATLKHKIKVDGEEVEVTLAELQAGYQKDRDYRQKTEKLAREREAFHETAREVAQTYQRESAALSGYLREITNLVVGELNSPELAQLRVEDPAEWIARREEINQRLQRLDLIRQAAAHQYDHVQTLQSQEQAQALARGLQEEQRKLQEKIPDWSDELKTNLAKYLVESSGFSLEEVSQAYDHRLIVLAEKARKYDLAQQSQKKVVDKVVQAPKKKVLPVKAKNPVNVQRGKINQLAGRLKKTGDIKDAAAILEARMGGTPSR